MWSGLPLKDGVIGRTFSEIKLIPASRVGVPAMGVGAAVAASVASGAAASALSEAHGNSSFPVMGARGAALGCVNAFLLFQIL
jgi:hypothetical protein